MKRAALQAQVNKRLQLHLVELFTAPNRFIMRVQIQPQLCALSDILLLKMRLAKPFRRPNGHI